MLAIIGPHKAGKTTLLGAWYLLLGRGSRPDDKLRFSGSCSLAGWEVVAGSLRWEPGSIPPAFPPHTSSRGARIPGLLHLAFKQHQDHRRDYVMTDAPGEWFRKWAVKRETPGAEGARWAAEHADAFLLVADREALAGPEKGAARSGIQLLARRLAGELGGEARRARLEQGGRLDHERDGRGSAKRCAEGDTGGRRVCGQHHAQAGWNRERAGVPGPSLLGLECPATDRMAP